MNDADMKEAEQMLLPATFADLTPAAPNQGMNRSADQVRASMRAYVEAGRITEEGLESLVRFFWIGKQKNLAFDGVGALVDYSGATISRLFAGKYEGAMDKVVAKIDGYLEIESERQKMMSDLFVETTTWNRVKNVCDLAIKRNAIVRVIGPSQIGKTHSLREYQRRAKFQVCYCRIPAAPTFKLVVDAVCKAVGVSTSLRVEEARARVANAIGRNTLLIIDELHELIMSAGKGTAMKCMEWIRETWDNSQCGLVLCGTSSLEDDLINDPKMKGWLTQMDHRCVRVLRLPNEVPMADIELSAAAYGIQGSTAPVSNLLRGIRMNRLITILNMTASWCNGTNKRKERHPKNWDSFAAVYKATFEEA